MKKKYIALDGKTIKRGSEKVRMEIRCIENPDGDTYEIWEISSKGIETLLYGKSYKEINQVVDAFEKATGFKYTQVYRTFLSSNFK